MLKKIKKLVELPGPVELGMSKRNALPMRTMNPFDESVCWEDWRIKVKKDYPVQYFLNETVPHYFAVKVTLPLRNLKWRVIDFFKRPHLLDLRSDEYTGGYIDPCYAVLQANFNLLVRYINNNPYNLRDNYSDEEIDKQGLRVQQDHYDEAQALYYYWTVRRRDTRDANHYLYLAMKKAGDARNETEYKRLKNKWIEGNREYDEYEQEALERLVKIRQGLWT